MRDIERKRLDGTKKYRYHPACERYPRKTAVAFAEFVEAIRRVGHNHTPILVFDGMIIDGRSRYEACRELKITPRIEEVPIEDLPGIDAFATPEDVLHAIHWYVFELQAEQRQMSASEKAAYAAQLYAEGHLPSPRKPQASPAADAAIESQSTPTVAEAARKAGASERSTERALFLEESPNITPELRTLWKGGKLKPGPAEKIAKQPGNVQRIACAAIAKGTEPAEALKIAKEKEREAAKLPVKDVVGVRVPPHLAQVFEDRSEFYDLSARLGGIAKRIRALADRESSRDLQKPGPTADELDAYAEHLRATTPYAVCPYCNGTSGKCAAKETACHGTGWLIRSQYENLPEEFKRAG